MENLDIEIFCHLENEGGWKEHIWVGGYQWYRYTDLFDILDNGDSFDRESIIENEAAILSKNKSEKNHLNVYPNPAVHRVTISYNNTPPQIFDAMGRLV